MAQDLSIRAILTCQTQAFDGGMKRAARSAQEFSRTTRREFDMLEEHANKRMSGLAKKAFGAIGIGAQLAGEAFGAESRVGRVLGATGNIAQAAAIGGVAAGPWGAAIFGGITALKEFKDAVSGSAKAARELEAQQEEIRKKNSERRTALINEGAGPLLRLRMLLDDPTKGVFREGVLKEAIPANVREAQAAAMAAQMKVFDALQVDLRAIPGGRGPHLKERLALQKQINQADQEMMAIREQESESIRKFFRERPHMMQQLMGDFFATRLGPTVGMFSRFGQGVAGNLAGIPGALGAMSDVFLNPLRHKLGGIGILTQMNMAQEAEIASRVMRLQGMSNMSAPAFERGSQGYLQAIHDQKKPLDELVKLAKQEIEQEKKQATDIAQAIARQRVTVNMN